MIYEKFPEKAVEIGGIDIIGVVSEINSTAVTFAGASVLKNYYGGTKKIQLTLQITGMDEITKQKELTQRLCGILNALVYGKWDIDGISQPKCRIANFPTPTVKNERYWIYSCSVNVNFYTKEEI